MPPWRHPGGARRGPCGPHCGGPGGPLLPGPWGPPGQRCLTWRGVAQGRGPGPGGPHGADGAAGHGHGEDGPARVPLHVGPRCNGETAVFILFGSLCDKSQDKS